jgi:hypothetical protein
MPDSIIEVLMKTLRVFILGVLRRRSVMRKLILIRMPQNSEAMGEAHCPASMPGEVRSKGVEFYCLLLRVS